jgi:uncharacterized protein (DUF2062 family)
MLISTEAQALIGYVFLVGVAVRSAWANRSRRRRRKRER